MDWCSPRGRIHAHSSSHPSSPGPLATLDNRSESQRTEPQFRSESPNGPQALAAVASTRVCELAAKLPSCYLTTTCSGSSGIRAGGGTSPGSSLLGSGPDQDLSGGPRNPANTLCTDSPAVVSEVRARPCTGWLQTHRGSPGQATTRHLAGGRRRGDCFGQPRTCLLATHC
jgi:hypothetical protein